MILTLLDLLACSQHSTVADSLSWLCLQWSFSPYPLIERRVWKRLESKHTLLALHWNLSSHFPLVISSSPLSADSIVLLYCMGRSWSWLTKQSFFASLCPTVYWNRNLTSSSVHSTSIRHLLHVSRRGYVRSYRNNFCAWVSATPSTCNYLDNPCRGWEISE